MAQVIRAGATFAPEMRGVFGWNYLVVTWAGLIGQVPLIILAHLRGSEAAGFYRLATSIVTVGSFLETSTGNFAYPVLSARWGSDSRVRLIRALRRWTISRFSGRRVCADHTTLLLYPDSEDICRRSIYVIGLAWFFVRP